MPIHLVLHLATSLQLKSQILLVTSFLLALVLLDQPIHLFLIDSLDPMYLIEYIIGATTLNFHQFVDSLPMLLL